MSHSDHDAPRCSPLPPVSAIDVFCGAAGLSVGLQRAGIKIAAGIDLDPACRFPFEHNVRAQFIQADVANLNAAVLSDLFEKNSIRLLAGCAPCQPFSGYTARTQSNDNRWRLLLEFLRLVGEAKPELVTMENVPRLRHLPLWRDFVQTLTTLGYSVSWKVVNASDYNVPQNRNRLVLLASTLGEIEIPTPSVQTPQTVRSAIGTQPEIAHGAANALDPLHSSRALTRTNLDRIRHSTPGGTNRDWPEHLRAACHRKEVRYPSVYGRMRWDQPSPTITTQFYGFGNGRFGHPEQDRAITLREGALLQSFPPSFKFAPEGSRPNFNVIGRLIGNAVPPELARSIGQAVLSHAAEFSR